MDRIDSRTDCGCASAIFDEDAGLNKLRNERIVVERLKSYSFRVSIMNPLQIRRYAGMQLATDTYMDGAGLTSVFGPAGVAFGCISNVSTFRFELADVDEKRTCCSVTTGAGVGCGDENCDRKETSLKNTE